MSDIVPALIELINGLLTGLGIPQLPEFLQPYVAAGLVGGLVQLVVVFAAVYAGMFIFFERRIGARMMSRVGPNRVGPQGLLQFLADAVKLIVKEDIIPDAADRPLFKIAPYLMAIGVFAGFAVLPFSHRLIGADLNIGLLYVLGITSISVVGILMSGWASNSKWALFGGMRSAAQIVSYEIPAGLAAIPAILLAGSMSTQDIIRSQGDILGQGGLPWNWNICHSPMMLVMFAVFFVAQLAEGSRTPFDLPEAESELVSGYNTEYSGFRFAAYFLAEFANTWIAAALSVIVFFGGWQIPFVSPATLAEATGGTLVMYELISLVIFFGKTLALVFVIIQLRWTLPRIRVDQMMTLCWKYLVPISFFCVLMVLFYEVMLEGLGRGGEAMGMGDYANAGVRVVMFGGLVVLLTHYVKRIRFNIRAARDEVYLKVAV